MSDTTLATIAVSGDAPHVGNHAPSGPRSTDVPLEAGEQICINSSPIHVIVGAVTRTTSSHMSYAAVLPHFPPPGGSASQTAIARSSSSVSASPSAVAP